jgi:fido (protein-threonine AMPylation protein)
MVYIHAKQIGKKNYYSLRMSMREGSRVITKDICNLGSDISKLKIEHLEKKYSKEIRKSYKTIKKFLETNHYIEKAKKQKAKEDKYFNKKQILSINSVLLHYNSKFLKLNNLTKREILENFAINFAVNSNSIEGNTITLKEAYNLIREDITPKNRTLREVNELTNTKNVMEFLGNKHQDITSELTETIHDMLLKNIDNRKGFRTHDIKILGQPFKPSPARYIKSDIKMLLEWYNHNKNNIHPLALVTLFHHKFESIHPFSDGNGRTGRILINYILSIHKYPPFIISRKLRKEYLKLMNQSDRIISKNLLNDDLKGYKPLIDFIHSQFEMSYWDIFLV